MDGSLPEEPHPPTERIRSRDSISMFEEMETVSLDVPDESQNQTKEQEFAIKEQESDTCTATNSAKLDMNEINQRLENVGLSEDVVDTAVEKSAGEQRNIANFPSKEAVTEQNQIKKYFSLPVESSSQSYFDSLSSNTSSMMKSVSDITSFPAIVDEVDNVPQIMQKLPAELTEISPAEPLTNHSKIGSNITEQPKSGEFVPPPITDQPSVCKFFVEDKGGCDVEGKAFFDILAGIAPEAKGVSVITEQPVQNQVLPETNTCSSTLHQCEMSFLKFLGCSEVRQRYEAWIPSEITNRILVTVVTSPETYIRSKEHLTMPGIIIEEDMSDPVTSLLTDLCPSEVQHRNVNTADTVPLNDEGLRQLMKEGSYYAAINLTTRLLDQIGQGPGKVGQPSRNTPYSLQLWFTRLALIVKLRKFSYAEVESEAFGDLERPDLYYDYYPDIYQGRKGSMVPFYMRILLSELPQYQGNHQQALDRLFSLYATVQKIIQNLKSDCSEDGSIIELNKEKTKASLDLWETRECDVLYSVLNCALCQKDYIMVASVIEMLIEKDSKNSFHLLSTLGRVYLQLGDVKTAEDHFNSASALNTKKENQNFAVDEHVNSALISIAYSDYSEAFKFYEKAYILQPTNAMLINNMAVCLLYLGKLKEALSLLEKTAKGDSQSCLHDGIIFNTCTLYELESSHSSVKKLAMLTEASKFIGDSFNITSLKLQIPFTG